MNYYLTLILILFIYMNFWFVLSLLKKRNDVVDVAWGLGFTLIAWTAFYLGEFSVRGLVVCFLVSIWGLRLAWHIHVRNRGKAEDYRYLAWRRAWGKWFYLRSYFQVYILQGILLFLIVLPILIINQNTVSTFGWLDILGVIIWLIGFYFEAVGDAQLAKFIKNTAHQGKLMRTGLWAYTRHPNYFGEVTLWWGLWIITLSVPNGWVGIISPIVITILILKISGIPMLENKMSEHPEFADYKKRVSKFFPLPPKQ